jgi:hypothetical protein
MILEGDFRGATADSLKPSKYAFASASYGEPQCLNNLQTISTTFPPESRATTPILATLGLGQKPAFVLSFTQPCAGGFHFFFRTDGPLPLPG